MSTSAISNVNSWEKFNRMVNVAKARNSALNMPETKSIPKVPTTAALSTKIYGVDKSVSSPKVVKGGRFDAYA